MENKSKWSLNAYFKSIKRFKWWIIGATVLCMVGGYLAFLLGVNPSKEAFSSKFTYCINVTEQYDTNIKEGDKKTVVNYRFVDGSIFDYNEVVSLENMKKVADRKPDLYKKLNLEKMSKDNAISIKLDGYENSSTGEFIAYVPYNYEVSAKKKYFSSESVGKQFIKDLIEETNVTAAAANNRFEITNVVTESFYESYLAYQTEMLISEYSEIEKTYKAIIEKFSSSTFANESGVSVGAFYTDFKLSFIEGDATKLENVQGAIVANRLLNYTPGKEAETQENIKATGDGYVAAVKRNLQTIESNRKTLDSLTSVSILNKSDENYIKSILDLTDAIQELEAKNESMIQYLQMAGYTVPKQVTADNVDTIKLDDMSLNGYYQHLNDPTLGGWDEACVAAQAKVKEIAGKLEEKRVVANDNYHYVYNTFLNKTTYNYSGSVKLSGHISNILGIIIGLVAGFAISSFVCASIEVYKEEVAEEKK